jgi:ArsR family transcriptional regulator
MSAPAPIETEIADLAASLSHPARVQILRILLRKGPLTVTELVRELPQAQSTVSEHLRVLRVAGMVSARKLGRHTRYEGAPLALRRLSSLLAGVAVSVAR